MEKSHFLALEFQTGFCTLKAEADLREREDENMRVSLRPVPLSREWTRQMCFMPPRVWGPESRNGPWIASERGLMGGDGPLALARLRKSSTRADGLSRLVASGAPRAPHGTGSCGDMS